MSGISVITLTLNEERNITECLESVSWADQRIVIDAGSTDRTLELARRQTDDVVVLPWRGFGAARNKGLEMAREEWILWLDADERVTPALATELRGVVARGGDPAIAGYLLARRAYFCGKWIRHCGWYPSRVVRLFRRSRGRFSQTHVHEQLLLDGAVRGLANDLLHFTDPDLYHYFSKFNAYTSLGAADMVETGRRFRLIDLIVRPPFQFFKMYILRLGFLDGMHGFVLCLASSAYVFAKYTKLWELTKEQTA
ncbi:MAG: glycosyltransferase family 2 protein [Bacteroidota bacterium]